MPPQADQMGESPGGYTMIVYFTGTGNSRYAAEFLSDRLHEELIDATAWIREKKPAELRSERPWVFVSPTYGWQIPHIFADWIRAGFFRGSRDAYFVMTCGDGIGMAGKRNEALCTEKAFRCLGTAKIVMPENYIAMFAVPDAEKAEHIRVAARDDLEALAALIGQGIPLPAPAVGAVDRIYTSLVNPLFYRLFVKSDPFFVTDACISCGKCAAACPLGNITMVAGKPRWGGDCTHCMACICGCPAGAIEYGKKSRGKPRYQCPHYRPE